MFNHRVRWIVACLTLLFVAIGQIDLPKKAHASSSTVQSGGMLLESDLASFLAKAENLAISTEQKLVPFSVELARDDAERAKGLMFRTSLDENHGMLFDFGKEQQIYMWMKNTYVSLDMLFIAPDGTIKHIVKNTTPLSQSIIGSGGPVRYVLEVKSGTADRIKAKAGDMVLHQLFTSKSGK